MLVAGNMQKDVMFKAAIGRTPLVPVSIRFNDLMSTAQLKLESANPTGSAKDRTAATLLEHMHRERPFTPGDVVVESTSGNLGLAMGRLLNEIGCRLIAVTDPNTAPEMRRLLTASDAEVIVVNEPDGQGGYLLNRLRTVHELCAAHPRYRWSNQYENSANPLAHEQTTGPEILAQAGAGLDAVYVAVSTGGTLAGISRYLRSAAPSVRLVAVDIEGSLALGGQPCRRLLSGIGTSRASAFLTPSAYDAVRIVTATRSIALCHMLYEDTGLYLGGSSGSVLTALLGDVSQAERPTAPVCLMADGGERYADTFYRDSWLLEQGLSEDVYLVKKELRASGLRFELPPEK
jgi:N-(2-amino-2-carboxyethyl)-L-glutamate synthase